MCHVRRPPTGNEAQWIFEDKQIPLAPADGLLVRVLVAKVVKAEVVKAICSRVPIPQADASWNSMSWVKYALDMLSSDFNALGTSKLDWLSVREGAMTFVQKKKDKHRFDGKGKGKGKGKFDSSKVPTFDLLRGKETVA